MRLDERADNEIAQLEMELAAMKCDLTGRFPIDAYMSDVKAYRQIRRNTYFSRRRIDKFEDTARSHGSHALALHHKLALASFIRDSMERLRDGNLPDEVQCLYREWFERIMDDFARRNDEYYNHQNPLFRFDLGVCCLKSIPVGGAWIVQISRVGFLPFLGGGVGEFISYARFLVLRMRGFSYFCVIHTAERYLPRFNERNMYLAYLRIADLMRRDARIRGIYRRSWFLDPKLAEISPELVYLGRVPRENGACFFPSRTLAADRRQALAMSVNRRNLHAAGKYNPQGYAYIWPRQVFFEWVDKQVACRAF